MLAECERERIHVPGAIQSTGAMVAADDAGTIRSVSGNIGLFIGLEPAELIGSPITIIPGIASIASRVFAEAHEIKEPPAARVDGLDGPLDAVAHRNTQGFAIFEFERASPADPERAMQLVGVATEARDRANDAIAAADTVSELFNAAAIGIRELSWFDRVLVYRFDQDFNGEVVAEARTTSEESFLGHHFPASDIPAQARELYKRKPVRVIADASYKPVPLVGETPEAIDLSQSWLRAVSPVHVEYMKNMGTAASLVLSVLRPDGELWGMISCHHPRPLRVPHVVRSAVASVGRMLGRLIVQEESIQSQQRLVEGERRLRDLLGKLAEEERLEVALRRNTDAVLGLVEAAGAAAVVRGMPTVLGRTPPPSWIVEAAQRIFETVDEPVFATDTLSDIWPDAAEHKDTAAGMLAVSLSSARPDVLMWFRPEVLRERTWAGDPTMKTVLRIGDEYRIGPRRSFSAWKEIVENRALQWEPWELEVATSLRSALLNVVLRIDTLAREITERERAEWRARDSAEALRKANAELLAVSRAANAASDAKSSFLANMSHEIRTPMTSILGYAGLLRDLAENPTKKPERAEAVDSILRSGGYLMTLIEDVLDLSKIESGSMVVEQIDVDLVSLVTDVQLLFMGRAKERGLELVTVARGEAPKLIKSDPTRLRQILTNLVANAVKFTHEGGVSLFIEGVPSRREIRFQVRDTGIGIPEASLETIFMPFVQADESTTRRYGGTGLGLAISRKLAELMGGTLTIESEVGSGSVFTVVLPIDPVPRTENIPDGTLSGKAAETKPVEEDLPSLAGYHVLLAEDTPANQRFLSLVLRLAGAEVSLAENGLVAVNLFEESQAEPGRGGADHQPFDLVLMDMHMPVLDGYAATRGLRSRGCTAPIVALTANAMPQDAERCIAAGCDQFLAKPIDRATLTRKLAALLIKPDAASPDD